MKKKGSNLTGTSIRFESEFKTDLEKEAEIQNISTSDHIRNLIDKGRTSNEESIRLTKEITRLTINFSKCQGDNSILKETLEEIKQTKPPKTPENSGFKSSKEIFFMPTKEQIGYLILAGIIFFLLMLGVTNRKKEFQFS